MTAKNDSDEAEIVSLFPEADEGDEPLTKRPKQGFCWHRRFSIDMEAQRVYCRDCGREVPAIEALDTFGKEYQRHIDHRERAKREANAEMEKLEALKRQVRNEKAKLRRAERKR